jgi:hypothetical protein
VLPKRKPLVVQTPTGWALRRFKDDQHLYLFGLPKQVAVIPHATVTNAFLSESIIERITYTPLDQQSLVLQVDRSPVELRVYSPDLAEPRVLPEAGAGEPIQVDLTGIRRFFVLEISNG